VNCLSALFLLNTQVNLTGIFLISVKGIGVFTYLMSSPGYSLINFVPLNSEYLQTDLTRIYKSIYIPIFILLTSCKTSEFFKSPIFYYLKKTIKTK
jgi:hypothetical protein